ncbi:uncharacterized protein K452DRAFT_153576 [Aplosporella prunicola CBS 121167]|uniref:Uncharacterized protein n=1 Tax=Aplosporella prunicola CBS 121167 TaxID=1176127 RepID=A0A6A6BNK8_9PEZI|nr:uncharacterized protein K452DRAFT_153576 [Aplosporella prunicola CBS 121167]KAF2144141.1 hypothetical protein K452DRAFT_153576 [Aplosporella prunicola CBS 121167]
MRQLGQRWLEGVFVPGSFDSLSMSLLFRMIFSKEKKVFRCSWWSLRLGNTSVRIRCTDLLLCWVFIFLGVYPPSFFCFLFCILLQAHSDFFSAC